MSTAEKYCVIATCVLIFGMLVFGGWATVRMQQEAEKMCSPNQVVTSFLDKKGNQHAVCLVDDRGSMIVKP